MPQSDPQTSAITVADLRRILRIVLPHLSKDTSLPLLGDVEVTFAEHSITLAATDRFTLAAARAELVETAPAIQWANTVPGVHLSALARMLPRTKAGGDMHVTITATDDHLVVKVPDPTLSALGDDPQWTIPTAGRGFVKWRGIINKALAADSTNAPTEVCLNPAMLARWTHLADRHEPVRIVTTSATGPVVLLTKGAIGVQMPLRMANVGRDTARALTAPWRALAAA